MFTNWFIRLFGNRHIASIEPGLAFADEASPCFNGMTFIRLSANINAITLEEEKHYDGCEHCRTLLNADLARAFKKRLEYRGRKLRRSRRI